jgi:dephospho-CoA kinase
MKSEANVHPVSHFPLRKVVGLTGSLGSGKSTVLSMLCHWGAHVFDSDKAVQRILHHDTRVRRQALKLFGPRVLQAGHLNKRLIADRVFKDRLLRRQWEHVIHPRVVRRMGQVIRRRRRGILVLDVPLLFEVKLHKFADETVLVWAPRDVILRRLKRAGRFTGGDIVRRMAAQMPVSKKRRLADHVIDNGGSLASTISQARALWTSWNSPVNHGHN